MDLDWSVIKFIEIRSDYDNILMGFEFFNSQRDLIHKIGFDGDESFTVTLSKGERVVGIQAFKEKDCWPEFINL